MSRIVSGDHFLDYRFQKEEKPKAKSGLESSYQKTTSFNRQCRLICLSVEGERGWFVLREQGRLWTCNTENRITKEGCGLGANSL
ncbi:hypothetical protein AGIG_G23540 [Arapaima gigas]